MRHSESIGNLSAALVKAQGEMHAVAKDAVNPHFKSKYASLDVIVETIRPILAENGLGVMQGASSDDGKVLTVETMLLHKSGEWIASDVVVPMAKIDPQGAGGALTYGRRYGLSALLNIVSDEDDDGNAASRPSYSQRNQSGAKGNGAATGNRTEGASAGGGEARRDQIPSASQPVAVAKPAVEKGALPLKLGGRFMTVFSNEELDKLIAEHGTEEKYAKHVAEARRLLAARTPEAKFAREHEEQDAAFQFK